IRVVLGSCVSVSPPYLHSFPTRRSSDLDGHQPVPGPVDASVLRADLCTFEQKRDLGRGLLGVVQTCRGAHADQAACLVRLVLLRSEEHTSELQSREKLVCRLLLEKKTVR